MNKILIIDDEINIGVILSKFLSKNGFHVKISTSGMGALDLMTKESFHLVLCDFRLEDTDGRVMLKKIKELYPNTIVIIITGYSDLKIAVELVKMGAFDYISKPLYPDEILNTIKDALNTQKIGNLIESNTLKSEKRPSSSTLLLPDGFFVGKSLASLELLEQIKLVAPTNYSVIINGESGTGKESVAKSIHFNSPRKDKPFITMDCGSLTKELAGSEFFGHEKGSFTGALYTKIGHFELANGGTLFLDEVGNLSYDIQSILLRTVQERKVKRIGSTKEIDLDIRIIIATNENLSDAIRKGQFREDLFHRFNEFNINIPALRDRPEDILPFAMHFLKDANTELNKNVTKLSAEVINCISSQHWPGNLRELKNIIRRATLITEGNEIGLNALPNEIAMHPKNSKLKSGGNSPAENNNLKKASIEAEQETIIKVLKEVHFNKTKAAKVLNIHRKTLYNKMKEFKPS